MNAISGTTGRFAALSYIAAVCVGAASASYALAVGANAIKALAAGKPLDLSLLATLPIDTAACLFVPIAAALFLIEAAYLGWRQSSLRCLLFGGSPSHRTDVFYLACDVFALSPFLILVLTLGASAAIDAWVAAPRTWRPAADLPMWLAVPLFFLIENFVVYWMHRFMHSRLMWPLHAIHHASEEMTALTAARHHPLDGLAGDMPVVVLAALLAFPPDAVFVASLCSGVLTMMIHTRLPMPMWIERKLVSGPRFHGIHHSTDPVDHDSNFSLLPVFDRLFGTFRWHDRPLSAGVADPRFDTGRPLRDIVSTFAIWLDGLRGRTATVELPAAMR